MARLDGKVALVTGGGRGIGRATALQLAAEGAAVVVNDIGSGLDGSGEDAGVAATVVKEIESQGGRAAANTDSVATFEGAQAMVDRALDAFGRLDVLVTCAGNTVQKLPWDVTPDEWDRTVGIHLTGHFATMRAASGPMREQQTGRMIAITSHVGLYGLPDAPAYCAVKSGVTGLTKSFSMALAEYGVTVNAVAPSAVTRMSDTVPVDVLKQRAEMAGVQLPPDLTDDQIRLMMIGDPTAVANFISYLATDDAAAINGQIFGVISGHVGVFGPWTETATIDKPVPWTIDELVEEVPTALTAAAPTE